MSIALCLALGEGIIITKKRRMVLLCCRYGYFINESKRQKNKKNIKIKTPSTCLCWSRNSYTIINKNKEEAIMVAYASKEFDPNDPDTISKEIN